jgi:hypothetical protein
MATLTKAVLGKVRGTIGDITFRQRNGINFIATRPSSFTPGSDAASIARRDRFGAAIRLASAVNSLPELRSLWDAAAPANLSPFNCILQSNYPMLEGGDYAGGAILVPSIGFALNAFSSSLASSGATVSVGPIGAQAQIDVAVESTMKVVGVVCLTEPTDPNGEKRKVLPISSEAKPTNLTQAVEFVISFNSVHSQLFGKYGNPLAYFAVVTLDAAGKVIHYSNTLSA